MCMVFHLELLSSLKATFNIMTLCAIKRRTMYIVKLISLTISLYIVYRHPPGAWRLVTQMLYATSLYIYVATLPIQILAGTKFEFCWTLQLKIGHITVILLVMSIINTAPWSYTHISDTHLQTGVCILSLILCTCAVYWYLLFCERHHIVNQESTRLKVVHDLNQT